jgi:hypothetical protein
MSAIGQRTTGRGGAYRAAVLTVALLAGACSSAGVGAPSPSATDAGRAGSGGFSDFFSNSSAKAPQTVAGAQPDVNCPRVEVRGGASTLTIAPEDDKSALALKYQGSFAREARECAVVDGNMVMKVGVEGRVVVGPRGGPGQVDVPLRLAVVQEVPGGMRAIATKFVVVPVVIAPNVGNVIFTHVEEALTFPLPTPTSLLEDYIVYVGFDPLSAQAQQKPPPKTRPKPKLKPAASTN